MATAYLSGRYEEALQASERALELDPGFVLALYMTALTCCQLAQFERAIEMLEHVASLSKRNPVFIALLAHAYGLAGRPAEAMAILDELNSRRANEYVVPTADLLIWAGVGDRDKTYEALVAAVDEGVGGAAINLWIGPHRDALAREPRFAELFDRLKLAPSVPRT